MPVRLCHLPAQNALLPDSLRVKAEKGLWANRICPFVAFLAESPYCPFYLINSALVHTDLLLFLEPTGILRPQDLCTCCSLCLKCYSFRFSHGLLLHFL